MKRKNETYCKEAIHGLERKLHRNIMCTHKFVFLAVLFTLEFFKIYHKLYGHFLQFLINKKLNLDCKVQQVTTCILRLNSEILFIV